MINPTLHKVRAGFFARHETFTPRYGWLKKGYDGVARLTSSGGDAGIFDRKDAIEILGVGKNMVRSIRFWCLAFHLIAPEQNPEAPRVSGPMRSTSLGDALLAENGWDPYLEDPASLWLLHWQLFVPPVVAPAWSIGVNQSFPGGFSSKDLTRKIIDYTADIPEFSRLSPSSFEKDASCFIRMYGPPGVGKSEEIECPFTHLGFLTAAENKGHYRFQMGEKPDLPDAVFLSACFDFARHHGSGTKTLSLGSIAYEWNSPGRVFQLSETDIGNRLERAAAHVDGVVFTESYGNRQLQFETDPGLLSETALSGYYADERRRAA